MVGVDQARQQHVLAGIEDLLAGACRLLAEAQHFNDQAVLQHQAATGVEGIAGEDGQGIF